MNDSHLVLLSVPGLRDQDLAAMPHLQRLTSAGDRCELLGSFPQVTWPAQANMLTGKRPAEHGVVANGFYWRDTQQVEMWTAGNDKIQAQQVWDVLHEIRPELTSAVWFPMLSKGCGADYVCMPAPIHNPDGSESLWCYTKPTELYGELRDALGHFPLQNFWGPLAGIAATDWIVQSAILAARKYAPHFFYLYLPHLDYAAQKAGPDSDAAHSALGELDAVLGQLIDGFQSAYDSTDLVWMVASEYTIEPVDHVSFPNRVLRQAGLLCVREADQGELLDVGQSRAWCLVDHQFSHVFVRDADRATIRQVVELFRDQPGIQHVLAGDARAVMAMNHERSGEVILISDTNSWQAYYYWLDDDRAPSFARKVDIHRKPGYDPVELFFDPTAKGIPLDATLVRGSHGAATQPNDAVFLSSHPNIVPGDATKIRDVDLATIILNQFTA